jgi:hypothetical protein
MSSFYSLLQDGEKDRKGSRKASARRKQIGEQQSGSARLENVTDFRSKAFTMAPGDPELTRQFVRVGNAMSSLDQDFTYIGSFRHAPERTYYQSAQTVAKIGRFGEHYIDQLSKWEHDKAPQFRNLLKRLRELQLLSNIRINRLPGGRLDVIVKTQGRGVTASLADVGFGVSQFLPIIIADLQLGPRTTLAVSQPEIHLHPSVQAATTNYFVDQAIRHDKRYILETHSEYIVNRLRLLVVEERIKPEDISVVYLERGTSGVELRQIEFTKDGRILGAPEEYFATYLADVMDIALKA